MSRQAARRARRRPAAPALAAVLALAGASLAGCVSLLPKQKPAQLYRFGVPTPTAASTAGSGDEAARVSVIAPPVAVTPAASTDQLLTTTGRQAAFIAGVRWISPAAVLWDDAMRRAFTAQATHVRLLTRSEIGGGRAFLRFDVPEFEARYAVEGAAPTLHVALHALFTQRNGAFSAERTFTADVPAAENRVDAIVAAYDAAVTQVLAAAVGWADAHVDAAAEAPPGAEPPAGAARTTTTRSTLTSSTTSSPR